MEGPLVEVLGEGALSVAGPGAVQAQLAAFLASPTGASDGYVFGNH